MGKEKAKVKTIGILKSVPGLHMTTLDMSSQTQPHVYQGGGTGAL